MSSNAFAQLERDENRREEQIERAREERQSVVTKDWRFTVNDAHDGVWLHFSTVNAVSGGCVLLSPDQARDLARLLALSAVQ